MFLMSARCVRPHGGLVNCSDAYVCRCIINCIKLRLRCAQTGQVPLLCRTASLIGWTCPSSARALSAWVYIWCSSADCEGNILHIITACEVYGIQFSSVRVIYSLRTHRLRCLTGRRKPTRTRQLFVITGSPSALSPAHSSECRSSRICLRVGIM